MKAFIFAAGLGTRLKPYTDNCPKALVPLNGQPLIWHTINNLKKFGIDEVVVNVHHFSQMLIDYLGSIDWGITITISDESDYLLDTGGGLLMAKPFLEGTEPFIAINVDIISSVNLNNVIEFHNEHNSLATLVVRKRPTGRQFFFDENFQLTGWKNFESGEEKISTENFNKSHPLAFSGIHVISPSIFNQITETGKFSIVDLYLRLAKENRITGFEDTSDFWLDLGKPGQIAIGEEFLISNRIQ
jgi:NDP-sugar pyrophosphorylase family protein